MTNLLYGFGNGRIKTIATEQGWTDENGRLLASSIGLLSNRVMQGIATKEEVVRWAKEKLSEVDIKREAIIKAKTKNLDRIKNIKEKFKVDNSQLKKEAEHSFTAKIEYLSKEIELVKLEELYDQSDKKSDQELLNLEARVQKINSRLEAANVLVSSPKNIEEEQPPFEQYPDDTADDIIEETDVEVAVAEEVSDEKGKKGKRGKKNKKAAEKK